VVRFGYQNYDIDKDFVAKKKGKLVHKKKKKEKKYFDYLMIDGIWHVTFHLTKCERDDIVVMFKSGDVVSVRMFVLLENLPEKFLCIIKENISVHPNRKSIRFLQGKNMCVVDHYTPLKKYSREREKVMDLNTPELQSQILKRSKGENIDGNRKILRKILKKFIDEKRIPKVTTHRKLEPLKSLLKSTSHKQEVIISQRSDDSIETISKNNFQLNSIYRSHDQTGALNVYDLKRQLKCLGLSTKGFKNDLISRIRAYSYSENIEDKKISNHLKRKAEETPTFPNKKTKDKQYGTEYNPINTKNRRSLLTIKNKNSRM